MLSCRAGEAADDARGGTAEGGPESLGSGPACALGFMRGKEEPLIASIKGGADCMRVEQKLLGSREGSASFEIAAEARYLSLAEVSALKSQKGPLGETDRIWTF